MKFYILRYSKDLIIIKNLILFQMNNDSIISIELELMKLIKNPFLV